MGAIVGGNGMVGGLLTSLGTLAASMIFDTFAICTWVYPAACCMGI